MLFSNSENSIESNLLGEGYAKDFITSFNSEGEFRWGKNIGGNSFSKTKPLTLDSENNILSAGRIYEQGGFDSLQIKRFNGNFYVVKYDKDGHLQWVKQGEIGLKGEANQINTDSEGNVYVAGCFSNLGFATPFT